MKFFKKHLHLVVIACVLLCLSVGLAVWIFAGDGEITYKRVTTGYISPSDIAIDGNNAYVSDATSNKVYKLNLSDGSKSATYDAAQAVNSVAVVNGNVYAMEGGLAGNVIKLKADLSGADKTVETGHTPMDMVGVNGKLYVACRYSNSVYVYDENDLSKEPTIIPTSREPMALTVAGNNVYVACHLTDTAASNDISEIVAAKVVVIDANSDKVSKEISLLNGTDGVKGICTSTDGKYVYVSHVLARYTYPTTQLDRGWINTNAVTIIDTESQEVLTAVLLDNVELGAANPWGVQCADKQLLVSIAGTSEIIVIDTDKMFTAISRVKDGRNEYVDTIADIPNYMPFLDNCKTRITLDGKGVRNFAISDGKAYVCEYYTGDVAVLDIDSKETSSISLGTQPEMDDNRYGEVIWNDGTLCYQQWESCASCHPDGRVDGLNWDNLNDGLGNPKNVKSMLYAHRTPPTMITGIRADAEIAVRAGMKYIQFNVLDDNSLNSLDEYIKSMSPIDSPYLNRDGSYTKAALEGQKLFESEGCVTCHYGPNFTDMKLHKSASDGSYSSSWESRDFDTPTLAEVWNTAPYFASGQYKTLREAVAASLHSKLSEKQIDNLTTYVASIGKVGQYYGVEQVHIRTSAGAESYNNLHADSTIYKMSVKKQLVTDKNAIVTIKLYSADKKEVSSKSFTLDAAEMPNINDTATIEFEMAVGSDLGNGSYYVVSIAAEDGTALATDYTVYNND